jgi:hypothetical protein
MNIPVWNYVSGINVGQKNVHLYESITAWGVFDKKYGLGIDTITVVSWLCFDG